MTRQRVALAVVLALTAATITAAVVIDGPPEPEAEVAANVAPSPFAVVLTVPTTPPAPPPVVTEPPPPEPPPPEPEPVALAPRPSAPPASYATGGALGAIRACESGDNYAAVSPGGTYRGAYQFLPSTWNATAERAGRPDLVGVDPAAAAPADQDAMAEALYATSGSSPWPVCGR